MCIISIICNSLFGLNHYILKVLNASLCMMPVCTKPRAIAFGPLNAARLR